MTVDIVKITPEMAKEMWVKHSNLLAENYGKQRDIREKVVDLYAKEMEEVRWKQNGQSIVFDENGFIVDGQNRIKGIIKSNTTQEIVVVRGVSIDVIDTIDIGNRRSTESSLQILADAYEKGAAGVVKFRLQLDRGAFSFGQSNANVGVSNTEIVEEYNKNADIYNIATKFGKDIYKSSRKALNATEVAAIYLHLIYTKGWDKGEVKEFFNKIASANPSERSIYNTAYERLRNKKACKGVERTKVYMSCWNSMLSGCYKNMTSGDNEFRKAA